MLYNKNFNPQLYGAVIKGHGIRGGIKTPTVYIGTNNNEDLPHFQRGDLLDANATIDTIKDIMGGDIPEGIEERIQDIESRVTLLNKDIANIVYDCLIVLPIRVSTVENAVHDLYSRVLPPSIISENDGLYQVKNDSVYPVAHPDLSTQPSVLPQRFGNLTMYEVLVPASELGLGTYIPVSYVPLDATITECFLICDNFTTPAYAVRLSYGWAIELLSVTAYNTTPPEFDYSNGMALIRYYMKNSNTYYSGYDQGGDNVIYTIYGMPTVDHYFNKGIRVIYGFDSFMEFDLTISTVKNYGDVVGMVYSNDNKFPLTLLAFYSDYVVYSYGRSMLQVGMDSIQVVEDGPYLDNNSRIEFFKLQ